MNLLLKPVITSLAILMTTAVYSQKIKVTSGSLEFLKNQDSINISYSYVSMGVGNYDREEDYVRDKVVVYNDQEPEKGDKWKKKWNSDKEEKFEPKFKEMLNIELEKVDVAVGDFPQAPYTLILKTTFIEPGFDVGVMSKKANAKYEVIFIKKENEEIMASMTIFAFVDAGGIGYNFDAGNRIKDVFAKAGKGLGYYLVKKVYKE